MRGWWIVVAATVLVALPKAGADEVASVPETSARLGQRFGAALECDRPEAKRDTAARVHRQWCAVATLGQEPFTVPQDRQTFLGESLGIGPADKVLDMVARKPELALLTIDEHGALVTALPASERVKPLGALASLNLVMKGHDKAVHVTKELKEYLKRFAFQNLHQLQGEANGAAFEGLLPSHIYRVKGTFGEGYLVLEQDSAGTRVNLFPIVPIVAD